MSTALAAPLLETYARADVTFVEGEGAWLVAADGRRYLDLVAGIAVVGLGHRHPAPLGEAHAQLDRLWHASNLYFTQPMARLAGLLSDRFGGAQAFFCNSGAEAVESALKYARKATGRPGTVALENSFHGRTMGALAATGQKAKREAFEPLVGGVRFARANDVASLETRVDETTACVLLEPIQGEGGVRPLTAQFVREASAIADANGALLVFDEVQTGVGRTGTFFAFEQLDIRPDAVTLAKGLANGLPVGAFLVADSAAGAFVPGDHGSTFGGNPVACAASLANLRVIEQEKLVENAEVRGKFLMAQFRALQEKRSIIGDVRGLGLMIGIELVRDRKTKEPADREAKQVRAAMREKGVLVGVGGLFGNVVRFQPPLSITADECARAAAVFDDVISHLS